MNSEHKPKTGQGSMPGISGRAGTSPGKRQLPSPAPNSGQAAAASALAYGQQGQGGSEADAAAAEAFAHAFDWGTSGTPPLARGSADTNDWLGGSANVRSSASASSSGAAPRANAFNAVMVVTAWRGSAKRKSWSGLTIWNGDFQVYRGVVRGRTVTWTNGELGPIHVRTDAHGRNGIPLTSWLPRDARSVTVSVRALHSKAGVGAGGTGNASGARATGEQQGDGDVGSTSPGAGTSSEGTGSEEQSSGQPERDSKASRSEGTGVGDAPTGGKGGRTGGGPGGQRGGSTRQEGGNADGYDPRVGGQKFGDPEGARGGEGKRGDDGARGAGALWGGLIGVPRAWRAAVEVALIVGEATSPGAIFKKVVGRGLGNLTTAAVRERIQRQASSFAKQQVKALETRHAKMLERMTPQKRADVLKITSDHMKRKYFEMAEAGAKRRVRELRRQLEVKQGSRRLQRRLAAARKVEDAAAVKPVGGQLPQNHQFAGKLYARRHFDSSNRNYPEAMSVLHKHRRAGVRFTREGYPDFGPFTYRRAGVTGEVRIKYTGDRGLDFRAANSIMSKRMAKQGKPWRQPIDYAWHHTEKVTANGTGYMVLVPRSLHRSISHTGGVAVYKDITGEIHAYAKN